MPPTARFLAQDNPAYYGAASTLVLTAVAFCSGAVFVAIAVFLQCVCQRRRGSGVGPSVASTRWFRRTSGLSPSAISSLPAFAYEKDADGGSSGGGGGCAVCLESVDDGETVRRLPMCKHLFHMECIDMWLYSHSTCPVCRAVVGPADAAEDNEQAAMPTTTATATAVVAEGSAGVQYLPV
ncbi:E3 ubiquitin-protein ligase ATL41-like [Ananas comosus]|uniref:RING-type E3 ubiquitin transferase n=1 Tax=Ananas comosus TaxID=4615 RepID=A0A199W2S6_ANACO|nr:E3 ubiquitin-protein ligase ATL41-like [Ananas comosus]OAY83200.1 E3 ubiquitin-protein ligase ATL41 [Ananas comosus]